ncbi:MAG: phosphatidylserine decarboxylase family protein [Desulfitobacteriaceae bacterium]
MNFPIARDSWPYLTVLAVLSGITYLIWPWLALGPVVLFLFVVYFFRNPERRIPADETVLVSPADGVVMDIERVLEDRFLEGESIRIRIFLSIFNVHINRVPMSGTVVYRDYRPGQMLPAFKSHASEVNEKNFVGIENSQLRILVTQVTGFVARRIVCWVKTGDQVERGERFGLIKFGSCTELFLPPHVEVAVKPGEKVVGGVTVMGLVKENVRETN